MKNPIIEGIETAIAAHKAELKKYEAMLALYHGGPNAEHYNPRRDAQVRRHADKQIEVSKDFSKRDLILNLMKDGKKRTISDMVNDIFPLRNGSTKVKLKNTFATALVDIHREGTLNREENVDGKFAYWKEGASGKRGPVAGVKRGPYKKKYKRSNAAPRITKSFKANLESPDWRVVVPQILGKSTTPLTARQIVDAIVPGAHRKTKRVLASRCSAILSIFKKEGLVKEVRSADGHHVAYTV
jgi:hypothetical protein